MAFLLPAAAAAALAFAAGAARLRERGLEPALHEEVFFAAAPPAGSRPASAAHVRAYLRAGGARPPPGRPGVWVFGPKPRRGAPGVLAFGPRPGAWFQPR